MADLDSVARVANEILSEMRLHDQRSAFAAEAITGTQEGIRHATEKIADAVVAIQAYNARMDARDAKNNGAPKLTPQLVGWLLAGGFALGVVLKGGAEAVSLITTLLKIKGG